MSQRGLKGSDKTEAAKEVAQIGFMLRSWNFSQGSCVHALNRGTLGRDRPRDKNVCTSYFQFSLPSLPETPSLDSVFRHHP